MGMIINLSSFSARCICYCNRTLV